METIISLKHASALLCVSEQTLRDWDDSGKFPAIRTAGGHRRYRLSDVEKMTNEQIFLIYYDNHDVLPQTIKLLGCIMTLDDIPSQSNHDPLEEVWWCKMGIFEKGPCLDAKWRTAVELVIKSNSNEHGVRFQNRNDLEIELKNDWTSFVNVFPTLIKNKSWTDPEGIVSMYEREAIWNKVPNTFYGREVVKKDGAFVFRHCQYKRIDLI